MKLTSNNFRLYAMQAYDNPMCLSEQEFDEDLAKLTKLRKSISHYMSGYSTNIHTIINNFIAYYNVFERHCATKMLFFRLDAEQYPFANAVLKFLSLPQSDNKYNEELYLQLVKEFGEPS